MESEVKMHKDNMARGRMTELQFRKQGRRNILQCGDKGKNYVISLTFWKRIVPLCLDSCDVAFYP